MAEEDTGINKLKEMEELLYPKEVEFDPNKNPKAIVIIEQPDGNYKGYMQKFGKLVEVRDIGPQTVLERLLTHE
jgi:hypothetical protein